MEDLTVLADVLSTSVHSEVLHNILCAFPRQKKLSFDHLGDIVDFIILEQNKDLVNENMERLK